jgi:exodeoxyribonuclease VII large subunit
MTTPISLSDLAYSLESLIEQSVGQRALWVVAETSDIKNYPDRQYCFLTLVEREGRSGRQETVAKLEAVIWRKNYETIRTFEAETGVAFARNIRLLLLVSVGFNPVYGLRLEILKIDPSYTLGNLERERQQTLDELVRDHPDLIWVENGNYVTANQLLPRPVVWQRIALIAAPTSDGWRDFRHELTNNAFGYDFRVDEYLSQVQGQGAERSMAAQLTRIADSGIAYDAVVLVRGGGSQLDFGAFDTYLLGLAVASFSCPVLAGIGHERNVSITDLLCHQSVKTPTKAAAFLIDHNREFEESCLYLADKLLTVSRTVLQSAREQVAGETERFRYVLHEYFRDRRADLDRKTLTLRHLDPVNVLQRGYALLLQNGRIVTRTDQLLPDQPLTIQLADGTVTVAGHQSLVMGKVDE